MGLRHEDKFWITWRQYHRLKAQIQPILRKDSNTQSSGGYIVRSLYYETPRAEFAFEKLSGLMHRRKFRIRTYNRSSEYIRLEIKRKENQRVEKHTCKITRSMADELINRKLPKVKDLHPVLAQLYLEMNQRLARPSLIVEYEREAYVHPLGNLRITFDKHLRSGSSSTDLFCTKPCTIPAHSPSQLILEIKYDHFIPTFAQRLISKEMVGPVAISKYYLCRNSIHSWENGQ
ncbi:MAG: hypothetical protein CMK59_08915 [Proteobacteria bacterium]|nr:hypothetical protein [Pseudomonadota bacterium]